MFCSQVWSYEYSGKIFIITTKVPHHVSKKTTKVNLVVLSSVNRNGVAIKWTTVLDGCDSWTLKSSLEEEAPPLLESVDL